MKFYLAVAVVVLALIAYADAQDETIEEKLNRYGGQISETFNNFATQTKHSFDKLGNSDFATGIKKWFKENFGSS